MTEEEQLVTAERSLDRVLAYQPRLDGKVSSLFAVAAGETALMAVNVTVEALKTWWVAIPLVLAIALIGVSIVYLYRSAFPHLEGNGSSLIFFGGIALRAESQLISDWKAQSTSQRLDDTLNQLWRNSQIVSTKFKFIKTATALLAISVIPWGFFLAGASFLSSKMFLLPG